MSLNSIPGLAEILISRKCRSWARVNNDFYITNTGLFCVVNQPIVNKNLIILYFVLILLIVLFYKMAYAVIKR